MKREYPKTMSEEWQEYHDAWVEFFYQVAKAFGVVFIINWLAKKLNGKGK